MNKTFLLFYIVFGLSIFSGYNHEEESTLQVIADTTKGRVIDGEHVEILIGHVHAFQDTIHMYCEWARRFRERRIMEFYSNVIVYDGHHRLYADKIFYDENERRADCYGHVRISGESDSLYAKKFVYYFKDKRAEARDSVFLWDKENNAAVWGNWGYYNSSEKKGDVFQAAKLRHYGESDDDTLYITSGEMHYQGIEPKKATAVEHVIIQKGNFYALCDTAFYHISEDKILLRGDPKAWQEDSEMTGDSIDVDLDSLVFKEIYLKDNASIKTLADSIQRKYNLLRGKTIQVSLVDKKPQIVIARKNATSLYLIQDEQGTQGTNAAIADSIMLIFKEGKVDSISILGDVEGTFYPVDYEGEIELEY